MFLLLGARVLVMEKDIPRRKREKKGEQGKGGHDTEKISFFTFGQVRLRSFSSIGR